MREVTGPFLMGSFQLPVKVHAFFASHVPSLTIMPVDLVAFSYLLVARHQRPGRAWGIVMGAIMNVAMAALGDSQERSRRWIV
jgi:hypothetical protein